MFELNQICVMKWGDTLGCVAVALRKGTNTSVERDNLTSGWFLMK